jgi:hypothetical protein
MIVYDSLILSDKNSDTLAIIYRLESYILAKRFGILQAPIMQIFHCFFSGLANKYL